MRCDNDSELLPIVDESGKTIGKATREECHDATRRLLHPVVHLHVFDTSGRLYLQKRPLWKKIQPGKWDTAVGGHVEYGEEIETTLRREALEEIGITDFTPHHLLTYVFEGQVERELVYAFSTIIAGDISPTEELDDGRFFTLDEIRDNLGKGLFTPNFEMEFSKLGF